MALNSKALRCKLENSEKKVLHVDTKTGLQSRILDEDTKKRLMQQMQIKGIGEIEEDEGSGFKNRPEFIKVKSQLEDLPITSSFKTDPKKKWTQFGPSENEVRLNTPSEANLYSRTQKTSYRFNPKPKHLAEKAQTVNYSGKRLQTAVQKRMDLEVTSFDTVPEVEGLDYLE